jgi:2-methylaconitate cis-trans-isomerase PrpF
LPLNGAKLSINSDPVITIDPPKPVQMAPASVYQKHNNETIEAAASEVVRNEAFEKLHTTKLCTKNVTYSCCCIINKSAFYDIH